MLATVDAAKVFPYNRQWQFMSIPAGSVGVTEKYSQAVMVEVSVADAKSSTFFNFYMGTYPASGSFAAEHVYQNYVTFEKMSENELNNFVVCNINNPKTVTTTTPITVTMTNSCSSGDI